jgi:hypothetical protein
MRTSTHQPKDTKFLLLAQLLSELLPQRCTKLFSCMLPVDETKATGHHSGELLEVHMCRMSPAAVSEIADEASLLPSSFHTWIHEELSA